MSDATNTAPTSHTPHTVLIADDEAPIRMVVGDKLRSAGFTVLEARDGEEALDLARTNLPVAIVTDLQMPYMNGLELCTALKDNPATASIPSLLLTARGHVLTDDMLARTNIQRVMSKPFGVRELLAYVQETLIPRGLAMRSGPAPAPTTDSTPGTPCRANAPAIAPNRATTPTPLSEAA